MLNGARFLGSGLGVPGSPAITGRWRAKVLGNGLRELDRFLSVLLDEIALAAGWDGVDLLALVRLRDTAAKLGLVYARPELPAGALDRLRALGRCRDTLFYCNGVVRRGDTRHGAALTLGWPAGGADDGEAVALALGGYVAIGAAELAWICAFYVRIGDQLVKGRNFVQPGRSRPIERRPREIRLSRRLAIEPTNAYIEHANVACDGL